MTTSQDAISSFASWGVRVTTTMECLWLLTVSFIPLVFVTTAVMTNGYDVPKVTLYRSLVGLLGALWIIELGFTRRSLRGALPRPSVSLLTEWLQAQPGRWVLVAAWMLLAGYLISTLLSPSIQVSLWGREPALDGKSFYNTLPHFLLFLVLATHVNRTAQIWRLLGVITASGVVVGLYAALQYYDLTPWVSTGVGKVWCPVWVILYSPALSC